METKVEFRLTTRNITQRHLDINQLIEGLSSAGTQAARESFLVYLKRYQEDLIKRVLGRRYDLKRKRTDVPWDCRRCGNRRLFRRRGVRVRQMISRIGRVKIPLRQVQCKVCTKVFSPCLQIWGIKAYQRYTQELLYRMARLAIQMPYERVSETLKLLLDQPLAKASTVKRWVDRLGKGCVSAVPPDWRKGVIIADTTRVKAGRLQRGEIVQLMLGLGSGGSQKSLLGIRMGKDWRPLFENLKGKAPRLLVTDGDHYIDSALKRLNWTIPFQRCRWHMPHHGKVFLFRDGIPAKKQIPWLNQAKQILFKSRNAMDKWMRLIQRLRERGYHWTATYFENARPNLWTYQSFKKPVPTTTSLAEREMREINRRTDVGVRWSVEGVMNLLNLRMAHRFNSIQWNNLWQPITSEKLNFTVKLLNVNN